MPTILVVIGLVPFFAGRTLLTSGLVISWYLAFDAGNGGLNFRSALILTLGVAVTAGIDYGLTKLKPWARELLTATLTIPKELEDKFKVFAALMCATALISNENGSRLGLIGALVIVGGLSWLFTKLRSNADAIFETLPVAQLPGVGSAIFLVELVSTIAGVALAFLAPVVSVVLMVFALIGLALVAAALRRFRDGAREACVSCGASVHQCAGACPKCGTAHAAHCVGVLGRPTKALVQDESRHRLVLLAGHRCPRCADGLRGSHCPACKLDAFRDDAEFTAFVRYVDTRFAVMTPVFVALGFVPVLGLALALVAYRLSSAGAFAGYADWRGKLGVRVLRGAMLVGLALVQPVPLIGVAATWAYLTLSHVWTRATVKRTLVDVDA